MKTYCPYPTSKKACAINYNGMCCLECPKYHDCEDACKNNPQDEPKGCGKNKCFYPGGVNSQVARGRRNNE